MVSKSGDSTINKITKIYLLLFSLNINNLQQWKLVIFVIQLCCNLRIVCNKLISAKLQYIIQYLILLSVCRFE